MFLKHRPQPETLRRHLPIHVSLVGAHTASLVLFVLVASWGLTSADFITSSVRMEQLPFIEERLVKRLETFIHALPQEELKTRGVFNRMIGERPAQIELLKKSRRSGWHPNQVYHLIKVFVHDWLKLIEKNSDFAVTIKDLVPSLPDADDMKGACRAIIRLQQVYSITAEEAYTGNYTGFLGPPLTPKDALELGKAAFVYGYLNESREWLEKAFREVKDCTAREENDVKHAENSPLDLANILGLLGRVYFFQKNQQLAVATYEDGMKIDPNAPELGQLKKVLESPDPASFTPEVREYQQNMTLLCSRPKHQRQSEVRPYHVCRYHAGLYVPYYRYKEEILATSPFASIIYDVTSDSEIAAFQNYSKKRLQDGVITDGLSKGKLNYDYRASKLAWVFEQDFPEADRLSRRIAAITGLNAEIRPPTENSTAEPFQVVNYGLGGHYYPHRDSFDLDVEQKNSKFTLYGNRLATVLLYLTDVEMGGATVFLKAGISVTPMKGAILMWYNFDPNLEQNPLTYHAGCPVLKGHKWIVNKWIWTAGNMFLRPCGLNPSSTHLDVEHFLFSRK